MIPLIGFAPDAAPDTPGAFVDCSAIIPFEKGFKAAPTAVDAGVDALAAACRGAAVLTKLDNSRRLFAGTQTKLYELSGTTWTDASAVGDYTGSSENRWSFAQFGNVSLASNGTEPIQYSNGSGDFAAISGAPDAKIIFTVSGFVMALNYNDGTDTPDGWFCSGYQDYTVWTEAVSTQCTSGRLFGTPGPFTAGIRFGEEALAFKDNTIYLGRYAGPPIVWQWSEIPGQVGCVGQDAVCDISTNASPMVFFVGNDGFYIYDGTRPRPVGVGKVRSWYLQRVSTAYKFRVMVNYDRATRNVYIYYPSSGSATGAPDNCLVYNVQNDTWGFDEQRTIEATINYIGTGLTWHGLGTAYSTWDDLPAIPYDSPYWSAGTQTPSIFDTSHKIQQLIGAGSNSCSFQTSAFGDNSVVSTFSGILPNFIVEPTTGTHFNMYKMRIGAAWTADLPATSYYDNKFDCMRSARWHCSVISTTGDMQIDRILPKLQKDGGR